MPWAPPVVRGAPAWPRAGQCIQHRHNRGGLAALCKMTRVLPLKCVKLWNESQHRETISTLVMQPLISSPALWLHPLLPQSLSVPGGVASCQTPCQAAAHLEGLLVGGGGGSGAGLQYSPSCTPARHSPGRRTGLAHQPRCPCLSRSDERPAQPPPGQRTLGPSGQRDLRAASPCLPQMAGPSW